MKLLSDISFNVIIIANENARDILEDEKVKYKITHLTIDDSLFLLALVGPNRSLIKDFPKLLPPPLPFLPMIFN